MSAVFIDFTSPIVLGNPIHTSNGSVDTLPTITKVGGVPVNALLEIQSTTDGFLFSRVTEAERDAMVAVNGLMVYNTSTDTLDIYAGGAWQHFNEMGGDITVNSILNGFGTEALPSYSFDGNPDTGMWLSGDDTINFSCGAKTQFQIIRTINAVNFLSITGGIAGRNPEISPSIDSGQGNRGIDFACTGTGSIAIRASSGPESAKLDFYNATDDFRTRLKAGVNTSDIDLTLPIALPTVSGMPLVSSSAGVLSFNEQGQIYATGTLNSAQILDLYNTPIQLLAAPGASKMIVVESFTLELIAGTQYAAGGVVYLQYGNTAHGTNYATSNTAIPAAFVQGAANAAISTTGTINSTTGLTTAVAGNAAITITNATAVFTTGTGTARWHLVYRIVPIT